MGPFPRAVALFGGRYAVAALLGCTYEFVRQMEARECTPGLALALKIQEVLGVPVTYWQRRTTARRRSKGAA